MTSHDAGRPPAAHHVPEPPAGPVPQASGAPPWNPPLKLWQLFLLFLLTFGLQVLFWTGRFAGDMKRHLDPTIRPWRYVVGQMVPLGAVIVAYLMGSQIEQLKKKASLTGGPPHGLMVVAAAVMSVLLLASNAIPDDSGVLVLFAVLPAISAVTAVPWLLVQYQLNRYKATLAEPNWLARPFRFSWPQRTALAAGLLFWCVMGAGLYLLQVPDSGTPLAMEQQVSGQPEVYNLTSSSGDWQIMPPGTIGENADLELYGTDTDMFAVIYFDDHNSQTLEEFVTSRRQSIAGGDSAVKSEETRVFSEEAFVPISFASYTFPETAIEYANTWWVATAVHKEIYVEVIAYATGAPDSDRVQQIRALVHSLRLRP